MTFVSLLRAVCSSQVPQSQHLPFGKKVFPSEDARMNQQSIVLSNLCEHPRNSKLLTMICDGFDHQKAMVPRFPQNRTPKTPVFEKNPSYLGCNGGQNSYMLVHDKTASNLGTSLGVTCVLAHGHACCIYIADEGLPQGSAMSLECVSRPLFIS